MPRVLRELPAVFHTKADPTKQRYSPAKEIYVVGTLNTLACTSCAGPRGKPVFGPGTCISHPELRFGSCCNCAWQDKPCSLNTRYDVSVPAASDAESALQVPIAAQETSMAMPLAIVPSSSTPLPSAVKSVSVGSSRSVSPLPSRGSGSGSGSGERRAIAIGLSNEEEQQRKQKLVEAFKKIREGLNLLEEALI